MKFKVFGLDIYEINIDWKLASVISIAFILSQIIDKLT